MWNWSVKWKSDWCVAAWTTLRSQCAALPGKASVRSALVPRLSLSELRQALPQQGRWKNPKKHSQYAVYDQSRASQANRLNYRWIKVVLRDFVFCYLRVSQLSGCFFGVTFPKLEDFLAFFCRLCRVRLPLMYSFSFSVSALHPPRWLRNHRRMNGSVLPRSHSLPPGWEGVTARLAPSPIPKSLLLIGLHD